MGFLKLCRNDEKVGVIVFGQKVSYFGVGKIIVIYSIQQDGFFILKIFLDELRVIFE